MIDNDNIFDGIDKDSGFDQSAMGKSGSLALPTIIKVVGVVAVAATPSTTCTPKT